jgi:hypothetical protein
LIWQIGHILGRDYDRAGIRVVEQPKNVEQRAFAAARRSDYCVQAACFNIERNAAQCVNALFLFAEVTLEVAATERNFAVHKLDPRSVSTG